MNVRSIVLFLSLIAANSNWATGASIQYLPWTFGGTGPGFSTPYAVSNGGTVVVGTDTFQPIMWTAATGKAEVVRIQLLPGNPGYPGGGGIGGAYDISPDGSIFVGKAFDNNVEEVNSFRWTKATGALPIGYTYGARSMSDDGSIIFTEQGIWMNGAITDPVPLLGEANVSGNGKVFVGALFAPDPATPSKALTAAYWTQATGIVTISEIGSGSTSTVATDSSTDGSVIAGYRTDVSGRTAFRWSATNGLQWLGPGYVRGMSGDGSVIIGDNGGTAFIWDPYYGRRDATLVFQSLGLGNFSYLTVTGISSDGKYLVGGTANGPYLAQIPEPSSLLLLLIGVVALGAAYARTNSLGSNRAT